MLRFYRTGRVKNGKNLFIEAVQWAKEVAGYLNGTYSLSMQVYSEIFGDFGSIYWYVDYKDLATADAVGGKLMSDQKYWAMVNKGMELFIDGTFHDKIMRLV